MLLVPAILVPVLQPHGLICPALRILTGLSQNSQQMAGNAGAIKAGQASLKSARATTPATACCDG